MTVKLSLFAGNSPVEPEGMIMKTVARWIPVTTLKIGQYVHGRGPHSEFQGGVVKAVELAPNNMVRLTLSREQWIGHKVDSWFCTRSTVLEATCPRWETLPDALRV
jgi:hypothetical protein